jgi:hypothetical protein
LVRRASDVIHDCLVLVGRNPGLSTNDGGMLALGGAVIANTLGRNKESSSVLTWNGGDQKQSKCDQVKN